MKFAQGLKLILKLLKSEKEICDKIIFFIGIIYYH